ncbi:hypothetical protein DC31_05865 [Microbacterium sp. CH12i]|uniref:Na+/H+ antiporter NhaA n=1 Tax=Microbacterium sp. CH12i TaxID=1479651 RepID=UPI000461C6D0|nr:Na+/H+ antiporter NhaA [Microbacterium sp. CH12i]KDA04621.1 hypothetical protein DC31_05865 [Microbacterium sp. CH12i]
MLTTWLVVSVTRIRLNPALRWVDLTGVDFLAGIGFTVSLLIGELSFAAGTPAYDNTKVAILIASIVASLLAATIFVPRNRHYSRIREAAAADTAVVPDMNEDR